MLRFKLLDIFDTLCINTIGPAFRKAGQYLLGKGLDLQGDFANDDRRYMNKKLCLH